MTGRHALLLIPLFFADNVRAAGREPVRQVELTARVYDRAGLPAQVKASALNVAARALAAAGVRAVWTDCPGGLACDRPLRPRELMIRLVPDTTTAVESSARTMLRSRTGLPLGEAFIDPASGTGVLATIYVDRVMMLAEAASVEVGWLLGRAMAHEIGHLALGSSNHSRRGLMRAMWSSADLRRGHHTDWTFTAAEGAVMRNRLAMMDARGE